MFHLSPTITFILPKQKEQELLIEQINAIFEFSEQYNGFCEIMIITDEAEDAKFKLVWLAMKLNIINHPLVRTKIIRYTKQLSLTEMIDASISHALGQKIVITTHRLEKIQRTKIADMMKRKILVTQYPLDMGALQKSLA